VGKLRALTEKLIATNKEEPETLFRGDRWGKGKEECAPGSLIVRRFGIAPTDTSNYTALVTLCKGLGTKN
jgi:hypothetical protein